jgi:hypothetical protein
MNEQLLEQLYKTLYAYRFGAITFLQLLDIFEQLLAIASDGE